MHFTTTPTLASPALPQHIAVLTQVSCCLAVFLVAQQRQSNTGLGIYVSKAFPSGELFEALLLLPKIAATCPRGAYGPEKSALLSASFVLFRSFR